MKITSIVTLIGSAALVAALTTACASDGSPGDPATGDEGETAQVDDDATQQDQDSTESQGEAQSDSDVELGELYTDDLHDLDIPKPGDATVSVGDIDFAITEVDCRELGDGTTSFDASVRVEHEDGTTGTIIVARTVDPDAEEGQEIEEVVLTRTVEDADGVPIHPASSLYQSVTDSERTWKHGEGELPIVRTDGKKLTAIGVLEANSPLHLEEGAFEGEFEVAVQCD